MNRLFLFSFFLLNTVCHAQQDHHTPARPIPARPTPAKPVPAKATPAKATPAGDTLLSSFYSPPDAAKPRVYWFWEFNRVTKEGITRDLEQFKAKGISGVNLICTGGYAGKEPLPGVKFLGEEWRALFRYAVRQANLLHIEIGFNLAGGWTLMGPSVTKDHAMKKVVSASLVVAGAANFSGALPQPPIVDGYYHDIMVQAFPMPDSGKIVDPKSILDLTGMLKADGHFEWKPPAGKWVILRTGYTLTGHPWSKWHAYPEGDTFEGGDGYEIDYLSRAALDDYFAHLGQTVIDEARKAGGHLDYLWSDSWECGKLTWTQDFPGQFQRFRGYDLKTFLPVLAGYSVINADVSARFKDDFDRTIQDCIAENFYGHFEELCHAHGLKVGNEAGGPNDIPPQDVLKNFGHSDILSGEFWVNGHHKAAGGYNNSRRERLNLKQTATAAHMYGRQQAEAEAFTEQEKDGTHWSLGPSDLKPYANDAFCEGINRFMLHQATCQPPADGKPGYEFCAGQHFTPNITWWEQSSAFFSYLSRCQYMLQQGHFVGDVCFYLGERPPLLAPPKYNIPSLGPGYDCDYSNPEVLLTRMSVKDGKIVLPDGMSYKLLVLQNCTSPSPEIAKEVGDYQGLSISPVPSNAMSLAVIKKIRQLIDAGATVVGPPPAMSAELKDYPACDSQVRKIAAEIWGDLDGKTRTERRLGKGRVIWGKTPREILLADGIGQDFSFTGQAGNPDQFDYIHRKSGAADIYFVINRTNQQAKRDFTFRVAGRQPEIWDAVTGRSVMAVSFRQAGGHTTLPLELDAFSSYFVLFRKPVAPDAKGQADGNFPALADLQNLEGPWTVAFDPEWGGPAKTTFPELISWTKRPEEGIKYYSGTATYTKTFDLDQPATGNSKRILEPERLFLDLGNVKDVAEVRLNGKKLGILWCAPWRVEITGAVKPTGNILRVDVINLWANRVVHDLSLPPEKKVTRTHDTFRFDMLNVHTPLLESGLLGPVKVLHATRSARQQLPIPPNIQKAYAAGTRSTTGAPGKAYWQNKADYAIKVSFNPANRELHGTVGIDYINNSPDTLKTMVFKLYPNLYQHGSPKAIAINAADLTDGVKIGNISRDGQVIDPAKYTVRGTNLFVKTRSILPGGRTHLDISYSYTLNEASFIRTGQIDSGAFFLAYFFPRVAVYDDVDGWNIYPYTGQVEFYNDYGRFDVEITVPGNYQVWATGNLKNYQDVYQPAFAGRIERAEISDSVINVISEADLKAGHTTRDGPSNTWKFEADNVTDFAFAISDHYVWKSVSLIVDSVTRRRTRIDAVYNPEHGTYEPIIDYARKTVEAMSHRFPRIPYPYPHETVFDGPDEMEFPMMVDDNPFDNKKDAIQLTAHEIFHTIFPFYVGINETKYSFMDEGWATMAEFYLHPMIDNDTPVDYNITDINTHSGAETDVPVMTLTPQLAGAARFMDKDQKPALAYLYVKEMLGDELFLKALHFYIDHWKGRHPTPYDFFNSINTGSGVDLNWFWKNWFFEKGVPDLAITSVTRHEHSYNITVSNVGTEAVPVHLTIYLADGTTLSLGASIACWQQGDKTKTFTFRTDKLVKSIVLGTEYDADVKKEDNVWTPD